MEKNKKIFKIEIVKNIQNQISEYLKLDGITTDYKCWKNSKKLQNLLLNHYPESIYTILLMFPKLKTHKESVKLLTLFLRIKSIRRFTCLKVNLENKCNAINKLNYLKNTIGGEGFVEFIKYLINNNQDINKCLHNDLLKIVNILLTNNNKKLYFHQYIRNMHYQYLIKQKFLSNKIEILIHSEICIQNEKIEYRLNRMDKINKNNFSSNYYHSIKSVSEIPFSSSFDRYVNFYDKILGSRIYQFKRILSVGGFDGTSIIGSMEKVLQNVNITVFDKQKITNENLLNYTSFHPIYTRRNVNDVPYQDTYKLIGLLSQIEFKKIDITKSNIAIQDLFEFIEINQVITHIEDRMNNLVNASDNIIKLCKNKGIISIYDHNFPNDYGLNSISFINNNGILTPLNITTTMLPYEANNEPFFTNNYENLIKFNEITDNITKSKKFFDRIDLFKKIYLNGIQ